MNKKNNPLIIETHSDGGLGNGIHVSDVNIGTIGGESFRENDMNYLGLPTNSKLRFSDVNRNS